MTVEVNLPEDLVAQIDRISADRSGFITNALRQMLGTKSIDHARARGARALPPKSNASMP
jgi:metal-responsive CopG/Arc/MetJ family transcriptional regulator